MDHIQFLREIGRKGGRKRKLNPDRKALARHAANVRWQRLDNEKCKEINLHNVSK